jgi:hypothetical protein
MTIIQQQASAKRIALSPQRIYIFVYVAPETNRGARLRSAVRSEVTELIEFRGDDPLERIDTGSF